MPLSALTPPTSPTPKTGGPRYCFGLRVRKTPSQTPKETGSCFESALGIGLGSRVEGLGSG
eukprot:3934735-Rhodomonas_salina.3